MAGDIEGLIDSIYASADDAESFAALPTHLAAFLGASSAWIQVQSAPGAPLNTVAAHGINDAILNPYEHHFHRHDLWRQKGLLAPRDIPIAFDRLVPTDMFLDSEIYNDLVVPTRMDVAHCLGACFDIGDNFFSVAVHRGVRAGVFGGSDEDAYRPFVPHLRRMFLQRRRLQEMEQRLVVEGSAFGHGDALIFLDAHGRYVAANTAGEAILAQAAPIRLDRNRRLVPAQAVHEAHFGRIVAAAAGRKGGGALAIPRAGAMPWRISADPVPAKAVAVTGAVVVVAVRDTEAQLRRAVAIATRLWGLTPKEALLSDSLLRGASVEDHAAARSISVATARSQLRALLAKSAALRQVELVTRMLSLPGVA